VESLTCGSVAHTSVTVTRVRGHLSEGARVRGLFTSGDVGTRNCWGPDGSGPVSSVVQRCDVLLPAVSGFFGILSVSIWF
jgi:hypothetical protein